MCSLLRALILTRVYGPAKVQTWLAWVRARCFKLLKVFNRAVMLLLAKCYDKKWFISPYNWVIYPLTQPQVANQKKSFKTFGVTLLGFKTALMYASSGFQ